MSAQVHATFPVERDVETHPRNAVSVYFRSLLRETRCSSLPQIFGPQLAFVWRNEPLIDAFRKLVSRQLLSVPVFEQHSNVCCGFIDVLDILAFIVRHLRDCGAVDPLVALRTWTKLDFFQVRTCGDAMNASGRNPLITVSEDDTLEHVVELMARSGAHRVAILDKKGEFADVLTQSRLLRWITLQASEAKPGPSLLGNIMHQPVARHVPLTNVLCSPLNARAIDAFVAMIDVHKSALAVINEHNQLVGNLSASDLKECGYDLNVFERLFDPVGEFLRKMFIRKGKLIFGQQGLPAPYYITKSTTVGQTLDLFRELSVHRFYIVDDVFRPVGVVTPADLLRVFSLPDTQGTPITF